MSGGGGSGRVGGTRRLRDHGGALARRLLAASPGVLALDFDGTLAEILDDPAAPRLSAERLALLAEVAALRSLRVAVLSGRALRDVADRVGVAGVTLVGNHGLEVEGWSLPEVAAARPELERFLAAVRTARDLPLPVLVEDKGATATIHVRGSRADADRDRVREALAALAAPDPGDAPGLRLHPGKASVEVRPAVEWDKARALARLLEAWGAAPRDAFYAGDDVTDECVFEALRDGVTVKVGEGRSAAGYVAEGPEEVYAFLRELARVGTGAR